METTETEDRVLVTGGAGFIGSALVRFLIEEVQATVLNVDSLTYAGNRSSLRDVEHKPNYHFLQSDIRSASTVRQALDEFRPSLVLHLAAESHVDRSIDGPLEFVQTNVVGTCQLLQCTLDYWRGLSPPAADDFRFIHVSTNEVYGSLGPDGAFSENSPYDPRSPYSASKASSDHFVRAWHHTYGLPVVVTNSSNNFGPYQFPEKLIPLIILHALERKPLPLYGNGDNVRDWIYVEDHVRALWEVAKAASAGQTYNIGANNELTNRSVVEKICELLDELHPKPDGSYRDLVTLVADRPGHDLRYAIDATQICDQLGWRPHESFASGLRKTVEWYLNNSWWWKPIRDEKYSGYRLGKL